MGRGVGKPSGKESGATIGKREQNSHREEKQWDNRRNRWYWESEGEYPGVYEMRFSKHTAHVPRRAGEAFPNKAVTYSRDAFGAREAFMTGQSLLLECRGKEEGLREAGSDSATPLLRVASVLPGFVWL